MDISIEKVCQTLIENLENCIQKVGTDYYIIDKLDNDYIDEHYAQTHMSVSMLVLGLINKEEKRLDLAKKLLESYLESYAEFSIKNAFHHDFNNFAVCLFYLIYRKHFNHDIILLEKLECHIVNSKDSRHYTINWLPMRILVLLTRNQIAPKKSYSMKIASLNKIIKMASFSDYVFDDRIPRGKSFNLQYNISTIAGLHIISELYNFEIPLSKYLQRLNDFVDPTGDINYMGRGANQIFAWGPWIYLLRKNTEFFSNKNYDKSLEWLPKQYLPIIKSGNILINEYDVDDKDFWWDYHYSSVYQSHLLMWLLLSKLNLENYKIEGKRLKINVLPPRNNLSGIKISRSSKYFCFLFSGRKEYIAEKGPAIYNLWIKDYNYLFKGGFGPLPDKFGTNTKDLFNVLYNYLGPICVKYNKEKVEVLHKVKRIDIIPEEKKLSIDFNVDSNEYTFFNFPVFKSSTLLENDWHIYCDNEIVLKHKKVNGKNQYESINVYQSKSYKANIWRLTIFYK